jgi:hypothetical protein
MSTNAIFMGISNLSMKASNRLAHFVEKNFFALMKDTGMKGQVSSIITNQADAEWIVIRAPPRPSMLYALWAAIPRPAYGLMFLLR